MTELALVALAIALLLAVNGLYVAAEFALIAARPTRLQQLSGPAAAAARAIRRTLREPRLQDDYFATSQMGITLASLGLGMYGEHKAVEILEPWLHGLGGPAGGGAGLLAAGLAVGGLTFLHVVFGEMVPKSLALRHPEAFALRLRGVMRLSGALFRPFVWVLNGLGGLLLAALRVPAPAGEERILSPEELEMVIEESTEGGLLAAREGQILIGIMDFSDRAVHEVMTPRTRVEAIPLDIGAEELARRLAASRHTRFPVYEGTIDQVLGLLHLKDFIRWRVSGAGPLDLAALLRPVRMVPELMPVEALLETFRRERQHVAIVLDEYGGMAGLVSLEDLIEEVVGEVQDEFDEERSPIEELPDGSLSVHGEVQLLELAEWVKLPPERPDVATVGGLVITLLGRPAQQGETVALGPLRLRVEEVHRHAVLRVRVEPGARD